MSLRYRDSSGNETIVSGLTPGGDIEAGAVATRIGTYDLSGTNWVKQNIVFDSPMPDADYEIITEEHQCAGFTSGQFLIENKTANGFTIGIYFTSTTAANNRYTGTWKAIKTYSIQHAAQNAEDITNIKAVIPSTASSTNKLATSNDVTTLATDTDSRLDNLEDLVPTGASVSNQLATKSYVDTEVATKQDPLTFDTMPAAGSSNPVTSDGIKTALDNKQTVLTFDNTPTAGSTNPVTSEGVKAAIDAIPSNPVNAVANSDMHAVTSNAVYNEFYNTFAHLNSARDAVPNTTAGEVYFIVYTRSVNSTHGVASGGVVLMSGYDNTATPNAPKWAGFVVANSTSIVMMGSGNTVRYKRLY